MAASLVPRERRTQAVSRVIAGLTVATVVGVPAGAILGAALSSSFSVANQLPNLIAALVVLAALGWVWALRRLSRRLMT